MKRMGRKLLANGALILALILILSGGSGYLLISQEPKRDHLISDLQKEFTEHKNKRQEKIDAAEYDGEVTHVEGSEIAEARGNYRSSVKEYGIGSVYIPVSKISLPLLAGTSEWNLLNGVATASPNQELGKGLFVGISHNLVNERLLQDIDQTQKDDLVYLTDFTDVYTYRVSEQTVVHETDTYYLQEPKETEGAKLLLYRCEGEVNTDWRRILYADYIRKEKIKEVDEEVLRGLMIEVEETKEKEEIESGSLNNTEVDSQREEQFEQRKATESINQTDYLSNFFLKIYGLADSYTLSFFILVVILFFIYYLL